MQRRRERYCVIYMWKIIDGLHPNLSNPIISISLDVEAGHASFPMSMQVALVLWPIIVLDGNQSASSIVYHCINLSGLCTVLRHTQDYDTV